MQSRIVRTTALITIVAMALMGLVVVLIVARLTTDRINASLQDRVAATEATLTRRADGTLKVGSTGSETVVDSVWVFDPDGTQVSGPAAGDRIQDTVDRLGRVTTTTDVQRRDRVYHAVPVRLGGETRASGVVVATDSVEAYEGTRNLLIGGLGTLAVLVTAITAMITAWTVRRTLEPVQQMTRLADLWGSHDLESRFDLGDGRDELSRLGNTLDGLLARVAQAIRNEQQLTGELAHELRTPLTTIRAEAELGLMGNPDDRMRERLDRVVEQVDRLTTTISTLLAVARHQHGSSHHCDLETVVSGLLESHPGGTPVPLTVERTAGDDESNLEVAADGPLVERVLSPVLDNAVRYARTRTWVRLAREGRFAVVDVCDDGPGIGDVETIFQAGVSDPDSQGAGLGLPLARRVATSIGGSVEVAGTGGPTVVRIRVPVR